MQQSEFLRNEVATVASGEALGRALRDGAVVYLQGILGAGKTTFCRGILAAFGHSGPVKSPTYTLVEYYEMAALMVYHFDLYRLGDPEELEFLGVRDYFSGRSLALIEWPERGRGFIPPPDLVVDLNPQKEGRKLTIHSGSERGVEVLSFLQ